MAIEYVCDKCGSANLTSDTVSRWNTKNQRWVIIGHYNSSECFDCDGETDLIERQIIAAQEPVS